MSASHIIIAYGNPFKEKREIIYPYLKIKAKNNFEFYSLYQYCTPNISQKPIEYNPRNCYAKDHASEWLTRYRRTVQFSDATGLKPVKYSNKEFGVLRKRLQASKLNCDHMSYWQSNQGICFILIEPYFIDRDYKSILKKFGMSGLHIPSNSAPYSGDWENSLVKKAGTSSFFVSKHEEESEQWDIFLDLVANTMEIPEWNSLEGLNYV
jgi:hypothetical protein